jgi:rhamnogalacturonan endolyase
MLWPTLFSFLFAWAGVVRGITVTTSTASYVVDTASSYNFVVTISRSTCDITSLKFYGTEYQYSATGSHIASGLGTGTSVGLC